MTRASTTKGDDTPRPGTLLVTFLILCAIAGVGLTQLGRPVPREAPFDPARWPDMRIDVNTATATELTVLSGIGPARAEAIVDDRREHGPFATLDDLTRVPGIGPKTVHRNLEWMVAEGADGG